MNSSNRKLKMNKKIISIIILLIFISLPFKIFAQTIVEISAQIEILKTKILQLQNLLEELKKKEIHLSTKELEQGDALVIKIKTQLPKEPIGKLGVSKIVFLKIDDGWLGILGIDAKEKPGKYDLILKFPDGSQFKEKIEIKKTDFPTKELLLTKELLKKGYTPLAISKNIKNKENPTIAKIIKIYTKEVYFNQPFTYPLKEIKIAGDFGDFRKEKNIVLQHLGVDLDVKIGTPVFAINDGICQFSKELPNYGKTIIIDHGFGIYSLYLHLNEFKILEGERVKRGDIMGFSGNTGYSIEPHLHFSVKINGQSVDPLRFIDRFIEAMEK